MANIIKTNQFRGQVEEQKGIVVVDFFATWCAPCKMLAPIFDNASRHFDGRAEFLKIDIDSSLEIARQFNVSTIPTIIIFKDGKPVKSMVGFIPKEKLIKIINSYM